MSSIRNAVLVVLFLCFLSACRTTESSLRDVQLSLSRQSQLASDQMQSTSRRNTGNTSLQWLLFAAVVLGGIIMLFSSEYEDQKKSKVVPRKKPSKRRKK